MDIIYRYDPFQPVHFQGCSTSDDAEKALREGNLRYQEIVAKVQAEVLGHGASQPVVIPSSPLSLGFSLVPGEAPVQNPFAVVLGCSDARAPTELIFDQSSNELFIVRVAGNILGTECLGSVEYAVRNLSSDLRLVVVMGHSGCGAVGAAVSLYLSPDAYGAIAATHSLRSIVDRILVVVRLADKALERRCGPTVSSEPGYRTALWEMAVFLNSALTAHDLARELNLLAGDGQVRVVYGVYDIATHKVESSPRGEATFAPAPKNVEEFAAITDLLAEAVLSCGLLRPAEM
ncbi:carbonic anhydrase [Tundrisphaera lichenicola]|uniref:carbonic anhydrase n=1 Tax=Tundrisphaera lichenicola TaxID=2029860 RepID=UPI003EB8DA10